MITINQFETIEEGVQALEDAEVTVDNIYSVAFNDTPLMLVLDTIWTFQETHSANVVNL